MPLSTPAPATMPVGEVAPPPSTITISVQELEALQRQASRLRIISRTVLGVAGILALAAVLIVAFAVGFD